MTLIDPSSLLTIAAAAKRAPHSEITLRRLIRLGRLPAVRIGRHVYIHSDTLADYLAKEGTAT